MKSSLIGIVLGIVALTAVGVGGFYMYQHQVKVVYVDFNKVYSQFDLSKEYDKKLRDVQLKRQVILDSLSLMVNQMEASGKNPQMLIQEKSQLFQLKEKFEIDNDQLAQNFNTQIVKQINQYLMEFGKEKNYDFVLGANGNGSLMYANPKNEVTDDALKYINERYKGI